MCFPSLPRQRAEHGLASPSLILADFNKNQFGFSFKPSQITDYDVQTPR